MELTHEFEVPVAADRAYEVLTDIGRIAPCMPGATLDAVEGDEFTGSVKVKVGPVQLTYRGTARFAERDAEARTATIEARGQEARGSGTAQATIRATLTEKGPDLTAVTVHTDLAITGRPAQFGRGVMVDVGSKLLDQFAVCLADELAGREAAAPAEAGAEAPEAARAPAAPAEAIDLVEVAGGAVLKRLAPVIGVAVVILVIWWWLRQRD